MLNQELIIVKGICQVCYNPIGLWEKGQHTTSGCYCSDKCKEIELWQKQHNEKKEAIKNTKSYSADSTLEILKHQYNVLKSHHIDMPKLQSKTLIHMNKCPDKYKGGNGAHCHNYGKKKSICFNNKFLTKRAGVLNFQGYRNEETNKRIFILLKDTMALGEVLTHEIAHFRNQGQHNKRFYRRQHQLWNTYVNAIISGELYD